MSLTALLSQLEAQWRRLGAPIAGALNPGLVASQIAGLTADLPFEMPPELLEWYGWHDGAARERPGCRSGVTGIIGPGHLDFLPLADAVAEYWASRDLFPPAPPGHPQWEPTWFPLLVLDATSLYAHCGATTSEGTPVGVVNKEWDEAERQRASSLAEVVAFWVHLLAEDIYRWEPEEGWPVLTRPYSSLPLEWRTRGIPL